MLFVTHRVHELFSHGKIIPDLLCAPQGVPQSIMIFGTTDLSLVFSLSTRYFHNVVSVNNDGNHNEALKCSVALYEFTVNTCSANAIWSIQECQEAPGKQPRGGLWHREMTFRFSAAAKRGCVCISAHLFFG